MLRSPSLGRRSRANASPVADARPLTAVPSPAPSLPADDGTRTRWESPGQHLGNTPLTRLLLLLWALLPVSPLAAQDLRIELSPAGPVLVVPPVATRGALFVTSGAYLAELQLTPALLLHTNTPVTGEIRIPLSSPDDGSTAGFFAARHWAGIAPALAPVSAGTFQMGSPSTELERTPWEGPLTQVTLTRDFHLGRFEVTQAEYRFVMGNNPSYFIGNTNRPVDQVTWTNALDYCARLTALQRASGALPRGWAYRLPTEAEWEYACRAGTTTPFSASSSMRAGMATFDAIREYDASVGTVLNTNAIVSYRTTVGTTFAPNPWGLHDLHGNLWEWCLDGWTDRLPGGSVTNRIGTTTDNGRVIRGGCWYNPGRFLRAAHRGQASADYVGNEVGFRVVLARENP